MGQNQFATIPVALYGAVLWFAGFAYYLMARALMKSHSKDSVLAAAISNDTKERFSLYIYTAAIPLAFVSSWISLVLYVIVAVMWLIPDSRIEGKL